MDESIYKISKSTCTFCQTNVKNESETFYCPSCNSPYHKDCWLENKGCAVYGCGEKLKDEDEFLSISESIINIEYLINRNQFSEAIFESKQLLKVDRRNPELKNLYNKAVSLINNKINLMTSGDDAFNKKDYKAAEVYYKNVLKYADDVEANFVNTRLEISKEKIPEQNRRRIYQNILIIILIIAIITALGYLGYYTFVLKEDRDFSELLKQDNAADVASMENMIGKYENFIRSYPAGKYRNKALVRINGYSYQIANGVYKDDWRLSLKYYNKIHNSIDTQDAKVLFNNVFNYAYKDYKTKLAGAKKLNSLSKYNEALIELNNAKLIVSTFPKTDFAKESIVIESNIILLNKKISSIVKYNDLEREIREQDKALQGISSSRSRNILIIYAKVIKQVEQDLYLCTETGSENMIALRSSAREFEPGEIFNME
ncbi:MAG: hypothetical protein M3P82_03610, partial [Bacteroidota bacterium]|nr:hypothetical protein [Bacteroidota bacterium]